MSQINTEDQRSVEDITRLRSIINKLSPEVQDRIGYTKMIQKFPSIDEQNEQLDYASFINETMNVSTWKIPCCDCAIKSSDVQYTCKECSEQ